MNDVTKEREERFKKARHGAIGTVGFIGLGKLGLPVAVAMAKQGVSVLGYDVDHTRMSKEPQSYREAGPDGKDDFNKWLTVANRLYFLELEEAVRDAELLFVAVQTPHDPMFDGTQPVVAPPQDFDYTYLIEAVKSIVDAKHDERPLPLVVISTVLPGTMARTVKPLLRKGLTLVYNPFFIAMGTVMRDFLNPEFVLVGADEEWAAAMLEDFYISVLPGRKVSGSIEVAGYGSKDYAEWNEPVSVRRMSVESAELTKVAYNTFISTKIAIANTLMEICHKIHGANVDDVTSALQAATKRVASGAYMTAGMGDGGACHPRDNIALSWLAHELDLSYDVFAASMRAREQQSAWLAGLVLQEVYAELGVKLLVVIAGYAFKPGTNIMAGSPALLLKNQLNDRGVDALLFDPYINEQDKFPLQSDKPVVVVIGCRHKEFEGWDGKGLAEGSVIIDPHRITNAVAPAPVVRIVHVGVGR